MGLFLAPRGRNGIAQGEALGKGQPRVQALKRRHIDTSPLLRLRGVGDAPSRLCGVPLVLPRASPWAIPSRPFRAKNRCSESLLFSFSILLAVIVSLPALAAQEPERVRFRQVARVQPNGEAIVRDEIAFSVRAYTSIRKAISNTKVLLRELGMAGAAAELINPKVEYDDAHATIRVSATTQGEVKNRGRDWFVEYTDLENVEVVDSDSESMTLLTVNELDNGPLIIGTARIEFPPGTTNIRFDAGRRGLWFQLPPPPSQPQGNVDLGVHIDVRPEIMSCLYKIYGNPRFQTLWVARAIFRNRGTATVQDLRVRFRLAGYSDWSGWQRSPFVYPTQTVVEAFYPVLSSRICELHDAAPARVEAEWSYRRPDGQLVEESTTRPLTILGINETVFSSLSPEECTTWYESMNNATLIGATFISHVDPIVQQFAGMAARLAGGAGAAIDDTSARRVMRAVYELMAANGVRSQSPPWLWQRGVRQRVKFGRNVLQDRTGTPLDLAILYASTCEAAGLDPILAFVPGNVFPVIKLPGGGVQPVETTCVSGAADGKALPFDEACRRGVQESAKALADGQGSLVDVQKQHGMGVSAPELPDLPPSTLKDWNIKAPDALLPFEPPKWTGQTKTLSDAQGAYTIAVPADWMEQEQNGVHVACDPLQRTMLSVQALPKQAASLDQFVTAMTSTWKQGVPEWKQTARENVTVSGKPGVMIEATGKPGGNDMAAQYYLVLSDRHQLLLILMCKTEDLGTCRGLFKDLVATWRIP